MVKRVLANVRNLPRLRLSSIDPASIDEDLWRLLADEPRLMPHLHLSLQAASDMVLKRMRRRHLREDALAVIDRATTIRPGIALGADIIAGFPTETDRQFQETIDFVKETGIPYLHVFPYSERNGTPAARMPQVAPALRRERAARLRAEGNRNTEGFLNGLVGQTVQVLTETNTTGHCERFAPVSLNKPATIGSVVRAIVTNATPKMVYAEIA
jgi:threonylcarbamoyladenosine tRNA methylthiotransferase MtaB